MNWEDRKKVYNEKFFTQRQKLVNADGTPQRHGGWVEFAKMLIGYFDPKAVLDCGCATGFMVQAFDSLGIDAYGFELSEFAVEHTFPEVKGDRVLLLDAALEELPFSDNYFDLVLALDFFEHQDDEHLDFVMKNIARVSGGWIFARQPFSTMSKVPDIERAEFIRSFNHLTHAERLLVIDTIPEITTPTPDPNCPFHPQERGRDFWIEVFSKYGFKDIFLGEDFYRPPDPTWVNSFNTIVFRKER